MKAEIERRREYANGRMRELEEALGSKLENEDACIYVIGSYGRGEASEHSDLDAFIAGRTRQVGKDKKRAVSGIDDTLIKADLIRVARELSFPDFSGDAEWVKHHAFHELIDNTGTQSDDHDNTLTERLLLLLESRCVYGQEVYDELIRSVLARYWRGFDDHSANFRPMFLINDILRLWRTFCVNYEARTREEPDAKRAARQLKHFKLQHSRLLTCYSAILGLLSEYVRMDTVTPQAAEELCHAAPLERMETLAKDFPEASQAVDKLLGGYAKFLEITAPPKKDLEQRILREGKDVVLPDQKPTLAESVYELLTIVGKDSDLLRMIVV